MKYIQKIIFYVRSIFDGLKVSFTIKFLLLISARDTLSPLATCKLRNQENMYMELL